MSDLLGVLGLVGSANQFGAASRIKSIVWSNQPTPDVELARRVPRMRQSA